MKIRFLSIALILLVLAGCTGAGEHEKPAPEISPQARAIHDKALTLDSHVDIAGSHYATKELDPGIDNPNLRCDLVKMEKGGIDGVFLAVFVGQKPVFDDNAYKKAYKKAIDQFAAIKRLPRMYPDRCEIAVSPDDVLRIQKTGKRAIMIGMENGYPIGDSLLRLKEYHQLGARYITLCHGGHNQVCDSSSQANPRNNGLSEFGKEVVKEMNRLGMIIDVSHVSEKSFFDVLETTRAPIIASHSACFALTAHNRNLTDQQLKALAKNGGVIQMVAVDDFLETPEYFEAVQKIRKELKLPPREAVYRMSRKEREPLKPKLEELEKRVKDLEKTIPGTSLKEFADHIDHAVKIAGIDHVGIGSDFDGGGKVPGFMNHGDGLNITAQLLRRGYSQQDIHKIWGGNLMRVWREVEAAAERINGEIAPPLPAENQVKKRMANLFETSVKKKIQELNIPGLCIAVVNDKKSLYQKVFGVADIKTGKKLTPRTLFHMASSSPAITPGRL